MWGILILGATIMFLVGIVPLLMALRKNSSPPALPRSVELTPMGVAETHASSRSFIKWNHVDGLIEIAEGFAFCRHARFTLLPNRVIQEHSETTQAVRDLLAKFRNVPARPNEPVELFQQRFLRATSSPTWSYDIERSDLRSLFRSALMPVSEDQFAYSEVLKSEKKTGNASVFALLALMLMAILLIASSIPRGTQNVVVVLAICVVPFVLMVGAAIWIRKRSIRSLPRINKESYRVGLFPDGWGAGNEDVCTFHKWCQGTRFFLSQGFIGFRIESGVVNILPRRAIGENQEVFDFVRLAMKLKQESLLRDSGENQIGKNEFGAAPMASPGSPDASQANNPWETPTAGANARKVNDNQKGP